MKRIDENGNAPWSVRATCKAGFWQDEIPCGTTFEVSEEDIEVRTLDIMGECEMQCIGFKCPDCGSFTELSCNDIPEVVRNRVLAKFYRKQNPVKKVKHWLSRVFG